jgi:hypothetical protein
MSTRPHRSIDRSPVDEGQEIVGNPNLRGWARAGHSGLRAALASAFGPSRAASTLGRVGVGVTTRRIDHGLDARVGRVHAGAAASLTQGNSNHG